MYVVCMFYFIAVNIVVVDAKAITKTALSSQSFKDPGCITSVSLDRPAYPTELTQWK